MTMIRNACIDVLRTTHSEVCDTIPTEEADHSVESQIESRDQLRHVLALIKQLPAEQQRIMELRLIRGLEFAEIATPTSLYCTRKRQTKAHYSLSTVTLLWKICLK